MTDSKVIIIHALNKTYALLILNISSITLDVEIMHILEGNESTYLEFSSEKEAKEMFITLTDRFKSYIDSQDMNKNDPKAD